MKNLILWVAINSAAVAALSWCLTEYHDMDRSVVVLVAWCRCVFGGAAVVGACLALDRFAEGGAA